MQDFGSVGGPHGTGGGVSSLHGHRRRNCGPTGAVEVLGGRGRPSGRVVGTPGALGDQAGPLPTFAACQGTTPYWAISY